MDGDLQFHNNGTAVEIGLTSAACPGNHIGGNVQVNNNAASVQIYDNVVGNSLQCQSNSPAPVGSGNTAKQEQGQCTAF